MNTHDDRVIPDLPETAPADEHNRALVGNVHPRGWTNPTPDGRYNMVVIGAGTAGLVTAAASAMLGAKVALIERGLMGGDCLNVGCVPSKALLRCARAAADVRNAADFGVCVDGDVRVDFAQVMQRMRRLRARISTHDSVQRFAGMGIDVYLGEGRFTGRDTIEVDGAELQFARACIATGGRPAAPPIPGLEQIEYLTNETIFALTELPQRLAVIGAGPIGCELAQAFARFGSDVTLIESDDRILTKEDPDAAAIIDRALRADGVHIQCCGKAARVEQRGHDKLIMVDTPDGEQELRADAILIATGRAPNVEGLNLDAAGVEFDTKRGVTVDDRLRTTNRRIYAAGDVAYRYKFTHAADFTARIVLRNALFFGRSRASDLIVPWCTYTDPEIAHVGTSESDAQERNIDIETIRVDLAEVDRAILEGDDEGLLKIHLKKSSDRIVGATLVARHAGEMISEITLAMRAGAGLKTIADTIHPYPTVAEAIRKAGDEYNRKRMTPKLEKLFDTLMRWRR